MLFDFISFKRVSWSKSLLLFNCLIVTYDPEFIFSRCLNQSSTRTSLLQSKILLNEIGEKKFTLLVEKNFRKFSKKKLVLKKRTIDEIFTCKMEDLERKKYLNSWKKAIKMATKK